MMKKVCALAGLVLCGGHLAHAATNSFRIVAPASVHERISGRLLLFMMCGSGDAVVDTASAAPGEVWIAAQEVRGVEPGSSVEFHADIQAYPKPFAEAPACPLEVQAVLDVNHTYNRYGRESSDWESEVVPLSEAARRGSEPVLLLSRHSVAQIRTTPVAGVPPTVNPKAAEVFEMQSPALSHFWGKPMSVRAWIVLPPGYDRHPKEHYPVAYWTHGFGVPLEYAMQNATQIRARMERGTMPPMIWVMLDQRFSEGSHEFADSVNNGPWGRALTTEFIPALERRYRMDARPSGRLLTGHSSGGWATLQLQINYPQIFGGTWSTAPDSCDFEDFLGANLYAANENLYRNSDGTARPLVRFGGKVVETVEQYAKIEAVLGTYGGQISSFEWVFSPRGANGAPEPVFDRATGGVHREVVQYWHDHYDLAYLVQEHWPAQHDLLRGRIHLIVGTEDTFYLDGPMRLMEKQLQDLGAQAKVVYLPGRTHLDLFTVDADELGLFDEIGRQMYAVARPKSAARVEAPSSVP